MNILNCYASLNGQTEKIARQIEQACTAKGCTVTTIDVGKEQQELDLLEHDITFIGSGVYTWLPGKRMLKWLDMQIDAARQSDLVLPSSPRVPGKFVCVYCTYAGPHTGEAEATPAIKYMGQLFDHLGITIAEEWAIPSAFIPQKAQHFNTSGRLGNIEGRPNEHDLKQVYEQTGGLIDNLAASVRAAKGQ